MKTKRNYTLSNNPKNMKNTGFKQSYFLHRTHILGGKPNLDGDAITIVLKSIKSMEKIIRPTQIVNIF